VTKAAKKVLAHTGAAGVNGVVRGTGTIPTTDEERVRQLTVLAAERKRDESTDPLVLFQELERVYEDMRLGLPGNDHALSVIDRLLEWARRAQLLREERKR